MISSSYVKRLTYTHDRSDNTPCARRARPRGLMVARSAPRRRSAVPHQDEALAGHEGASPPGLDQVGRLSAARAAQHRVGVRPTAQPRALGRKTIRHRSAGSVAKVELLVRGQGSTAQQAARPRPRACLPCAATPPRQIRLRANYGRSLPSLSWSTGSCVAQRAAADA